jgi:hypothetical protein
MHVRAGEGASNVSDKHIEVRGFSTVVLGPADWERVHELQKEVKRMERSQKFSFKEEWRELFSPPHAGNQLYVGVEHDGKLVGLMGVQDLSSGRVQGKLVARFFVNQEGEHPLALERLVGALAERCIQGRGPVTLQIQVKESLAPVFTGHLRFDRVSRQSSEDENTESHADNGRLVTLERKF